MVNVLVSNHSLLSYRCHCNCIQACYWLSTIYFMTRGTFPTSLGIFFFTNIYIYIARVNNFIYSMSNTIFFVDSFYGHVCSCIVEA